MMNFVFVGLQRINTDRESTSTSLAKELAKKHRVLYVNPPIDRRVQYSKNNDEYTQAHLKAIRNNLQPLTQVTNSLWVLNPPSIIESINWLPYTRIFRVFNWFNNQRLAKDIRKAAAELDFTSFILLNDKDIFRSFYLKELLKPSKYVYLDRDYTLGVDYWKKHGKTLEPELMRKSDLVVCNSSGFTRRAKGYNAKSYYIGNGYDSERYQQNVETVPDDIKFIPGPVIGYVGALIAMRLDIELMVEVAKNRPKYNFVLIGREDEHFERSELHQMINVHFLGKKDTALIPAYIQAFDVCINPQKVNEITLNNFPLKIVEYLALGKPVVATATKTMLEEFSNHAYLAEDPTSFSAGIDYALTENSLVRSQERKKFVKKFSWENVAQRLLNHIQSPDA